MVVPPAPVWVPSQWNLPLVSRQLRLPDNYMGNNGVEPRAVRRSSGIYITAKENAGKPQLGDHLMKTA